MKIGKVIGSLRVIRAADCLQGQCFLVVRCGEEEMAALDQAGAVPGDLVLLAQGAAAARCCMEAPVDAAAVAVVEPGRM